MEFVTEMASRVLLALFGALLTLAASRAGAFLGRLWRDKWQDDSIRAVADTCVRAVEQMYREKSGPEKLDRAFSMAQKMLAKKKICVSASEMRFMLEAALTQFKAEFDAS